jgi:hypothetical protein
MGHFVRDSLSIQIANCSATIQPARAHCNGAHKLHTARSDYGIAGPRV